MIQNIEYSHTEETNDGKPIVWVSFAREDNPPYIMNFSLYYGELISTSILQKGENKTHLYYVDSLLKFQQKILAESSVKDILLKEWDLDELPIVQSFVRSSDTFDKKEKETDKKSNITITVEKNYQNIVTVSGKVLENNFYRNFEIPIDEVMEGKMEKKPVANKYQREILYLLENHPDKMRWLLGK